MVEITRDTIMGGRVIIFQPIGGYRVSIDSVLLAAAIPAKLGELILDVGSGTGAVSMSLAIRCDGVFVTGLEIQKKFVNLAKDGAQETGLNGRVEFLEGDLLGPPEGLQIGRFDHVMANPPYVTAGQGNSPIDQSKCQATVEGNTTLEDWLNFLVTCVRDGGSITIIHRYDRSDEVTSILKKFGAGNAVIFPLWHNQEDKVIKRVIVQAYKGKDWFLQTLPGLVLHDENGFYTKKTEEVLRLGKALLL